MGGKRREGRSRQAEPPSLPRVYEGRQVLDRLLAQAGAEVDTQGAVRRFAAALTEGRGPPEAFPALFPEEPRFGAPEAAMRLYGNLFGLWDRLEEGEDPEELLHAAPPEPEAEPNGGVEDEEALAPAVAALPPKGSIPGSEVPAQVVECTWQQLADLPPRERTRAQDRYISLQPELAEWARTVDGLTGLGQETLEYLCFELAEMFDNAFHPRVETVRYRDLLEASGEEALRLQPELFEYISETLDEAEADEDEPLEFDERQRIEGYALQAVVALTQALRENPWLH